MKRAQYQKPELTKHKSLRKLTMAAYKQDSNPDCQSSCAYCAGGGGNPAMNCV
ncbi:MAG: hypothetical protein ABIK39_03505 [candidate division WOR-3 bacterium]